MSLLIFYISLSIVVSFICSMLEAVILSISPSYLESLKNTNPELYENTKGYKDNIEKPLASILSFNTVAHTVGAAGAGAQAQALYGSEILSLFSAILTLLILLFSEIIPKSIGASYWKTLLPLSIKVLKPMVIVSYPLVYLSDWFSSFFKKTENTVSRDEIAALADISYDDGGIDEHEYQALQGLIKFKKVNVRKIMRPLKKVEYVWQQDSILSTYKKMKTHSYSRVPVLGMNINDLKGFILRSQLQSEIINDKKLEVQDITKPLLIIAHDTNLDTLLKKLLARREHMAAVVNEYGEFIGIITLEDLIEFMLGLEIFDELDS